MRNDFVSLDRPDPLTDRETEILRLMASGFSNKEIANSLGVAEGTIKNHVSNILSKLGVRDRTRAVLKAFELQLVCRLPRRGDPWSADTIRGLCPGLGCRDPLE